MNLRPLPLVAFAGLALVASACTPEDSAPYGSFDGPPPPANAIPFAHPTAIAAGGNQTCILTDVGGVKCWGANDHGQLGNDSVASTGWANDVVGLTSGVASISVGAFHACAVTTTGGLQCWGRNDDGQLGNGTTVAAHVPVDVAGLSAHVRAVSAGSDWTCALLDSGAVKCWGQGIGSVPSDIPGLASGTDAISIGSSHGCVLSSTGGARCFGWNDVGQLGNGAETTSLVPVDVVGLAAGVAAIATSDSFTCALITSGEVKCWGFGVTGQLGNGRRTSSDAHVAVDGLVGATAVATGARTFLASKAEPAKVAELLARVEPLLPTVDSTEERACFHARWVDQSAYELNKGRAVAPAPAKAESLYRTLPFRDAPPFVLCRRANGLAYALWKQGCAEEAATCAREAARHAGDGGHVRLRVMALSMLARIGPRESDARDRAVEMSERLEDETLLLRLERGGVSRGRS